MDTGKNKVGPLYRSMLRCSAPPLCRAALGTFVFAAGLGPAQAQELGSPEDAASKRPGISVAMPEGEVAPPPARLAPTQEQIRAHGYFRGTRVELKRDLVLLKDEQTQAAPRHTSMLPVGNRGSTIPVESVLVTRGRADVVLPTDATSGVILQSNDQAQIIGTAGRVSMSVSAEETVVVAFEAPALAGLAGRFKPLGAGTMRVFDNATGQWTDRPLLPATQNVGTVGLGMALSGSSSVALSAEPVHSARGFRTYLLDDGGQLVGQPRDILRLEDLTVQTPSAGHYWAVVRAIDDRGYAGAPSEPAEVSVLGVREASATVREDIIYLAPGERVPLCGQKGLIMRYGTSPLFVPAPDTLGLPGHRATTVEFRDPRDKNVYAVMQLAPKVLKTRISIGPATSTWPEDEIDITIRMWDGHGHALNWMNDYTVVTRVGLEEVELDWQDEGEGLSARLAPQSGPGPWVVRVSLFDSLGREVTRDFLEVAKTGAPVGDAVPVALPAAPLASR